MRGEVVAGEVAHHGKAGEAEGHLDAAFVLARDLALAELTTPQELVLKAILAAKLQDTRDAVRFEMLQIEGLQADRLNKLGLQ